MRILQTRLLPFKGFLAMNFFGILLVRRENAERVGQVTINHESIHTAQMKDFCKWLPIGGLIFYIAYFCEWLYELVRNPRYAYHMISFEIEAYANERNADYLKDRKRFAMWR